MPRPLAPGLFALLLCSGALVAIAAAPAGAATARGGNIVMGTVLEVTVVADTQETADALLKGAFEIARHWDDVLTTWRPEGELARLNAAAGDPLPISNDLMMAIGRMRWLSFLTRGAFDPGVGPIVERWRRGDPKPGRREGESTDIYRIRTAAIILDNSVRLLRGAALDSGGIGKGIALDAIVASFGKRASAFYLDFGGSSQIARGRPEEGADAWNVVIAGNEPGTIHGIASLDGASLSTSRALDPTDPAGAIIDPRTLTPVTGKRLATVIAPNATTAEAWSTALIVLGAEGVALAQTAEVQAFVEVEGSVTKTADFPIEAAPEPAH